MDANFICWLMEANGVLNTLSYLEIRLFFFFFFFFLQYDWQTATQQYNV